MTAPERREDEPNVRVAQLRWPLSPLASLLRPDVRRPVLEGLRCLSCPSFAMTDLNNLTWIVYHRPVLACFERVLQTLIPSPSHTSYPRVFAGHALLSAVFERLFGPAIGDRCASVLDARGLQLLRLHAEREVVPPRDRAIRELTVALLLEFIYGLRDFIPIAEPETKISFLRYVLAVQSDQEQGFPDRVAFSQLFTALREALETKDAAGDAGLIKTIERLIYTNNGIPGYPARGRIREVRLENKPQVQASVDRLASMLDSANGSLSLSNNAAAPARHPHKTLSLKNTASRLAVEDSGSVEIPVHIGPYLIRGILGRGGMGTVYRARGPTGSPVALKVLHPELSSQVNDLFRFGREVEIALRLRHPHIVQASDYGVSEGHAFLAMQLLEGGSLEDLLRKRKCLGEDETWTLIRQMASTLDYTWGLPKKYMHRDIKAENILFDRFGRPKLTDFGLAKGTSSDATGITRTGELLGTPLYMAPELVIDPRGVDIRADLWALGVLAWRCLTGHFPFDAPSTVALCNKICTELPDQMRPRTAALAESSRHILGRLLTKARDDRLQTPRELIAVLEARRFTPEQPRGPTPKPIAIEWRPGHRLFVFVGDALRFGRNSGEASDLCLRVLPASQFAAKTTCISGLHGRFIFDGARFLIEHQGANGLHKNEQAIEPGVVEWLDFSDRLAVAEVLDLDAWPQAAGLLLTRPSNHSRHAYLLLPREFDLSKSPPSNTAWPRVPARVLARGDHAFLACREEARVDGRTTPAGAAVPLRPGQVFETAGQALRIVEVNKAMFK